MKKGRFLLSVILFFLLINTPFSFASDLPVVRIGTVSDGPSGDRFSIKREVFKKEILDLMQKEFDVRFPPEKQLSGNWTMSGVRKAVDQLLDDPDVDFIIALGFFSSSEICQRRDLQKPVIAPLIFDREFQKLPFKNGASGVRNLNYIISLGRFETDVNTFKELTEFSRLAVVIDQILFEAFPKIHEDFKNAEKDYGIQFFPVPATDSADEVLAQIPRGVEAVYVTPLVRFSSREFSKFVAGLNERKKFSFSVLGKSEVESGLLATLTPAFNSARLARKVALNIQRTILGEDAGTFPVHFRFGEQLTINMATARSIDYSPKWKIFTEAELLNEEKTGITRELSLSKAVHEAVKANLDIAASDRSVAAGKQRIRQALAVLLPQINLSSEFTTIDKDQVRASSGTRAERTFSGSATLSQLLYSDEDWANYRIERFNQMSREEQREELKLDIALLASVAYLNVLRAKTLNTIEKDNLKVTRSNLAFARMRELIGFSGREEVFRWESQIATNRRSVLQSMGNVKTSEQTLNRLLNRPLEELFITKEANLEDPLLLVSNKRIFDYFDTPKKFRVFRDFMVQEGLKAAPELKRFDAEIKAQERTLLSAKRAFWSPKASLEGGTNQLFGDGGEGADAIIPEKDDTDWNIGVKLTFPLFTGGSKTATLRRAREELWQFKTEKRAESERIDENVRNSLVFMGTSYASIELSRDAAEAARKNLELITDSYSRGTKSIIDLLDAQSASLVADQTAENAVYDFLIDLINSQRATGKVDFFMSEAERSAWFQSLNAFCERSGVPVTRR